MTNGSPLNPQQIAEKLLIVTMALEPAAAREDWNEFDALMRQRESLIETIAKLPITSVIRALLAKAQEHESALIQSIRRAQNLLTDEGATQLRGKRAAGAYAPTALMRSSGFEGAG